jgi:preprotein translocase subunit YajC
VIQDFWLNAIFSLVPTILIGLIFWFIMRNILRADRTERDTLKKYEADERERRGLPPKE